MVSEVYSISHKRTGKTYIGLSCDVVRRWTTHRRDARKGSKYPVHRAIAKYGQDAFDWRVRATLPTPEEAQIAERILIALENPAYNLTLGGEGAPGAKHPPRSAEWKAKQRQRLLGTKQSPELVEKRIATLRGRKQPAEHIAARVAKTKGQVRGPLPQAQRDAIGAALKGRKLAPEHAEKVRQANLGQKRSAETCARIAAAKQGTKHSKETREKMCKAQQSFWSSEEGQKAKELAKADAKARWALVKQAGLTRSEAKGLSMEQLRSKI